MTTMRGGRSSLLRREAGLPLPLTTPTTTQRGGPGWGGGAGGGGNDGDAQQKEEERLVLADNEAQLQVLVDQVAAVRLVAEGMQNEINTSKTVTKELDTEMTSAQGAVGGASARLKQLAHIGSSKHMCWLVLFVVLLFLFEDLLIKWGRRSSVTVQGSTP
ncbi:hypothetical protein Pelo_16501 [Pelomyxa schiedti]|nr:hypothetical protein Pelo_16501 [Pelomyxa schiedti]